jgi:hypothetical protein
MALWTSAFSPSWIAELPFMAYQLIALALCGSMSNHDG